MTSWLAISRCRSGCDAAAGQGGRRYRVGPGLIEVEMAIELVPFAAIAEAGTFGEPVSLTARPCATAPRTRGRSTRAPSSTGSSSMAGAGPKTELGVLLSDDSRSVGGLESAVAVTAESADPLAVWPSSRLLDHMEVVVRPAVEVAGPPTRSWGDLKPRGLAPRAAAHNRIGGADHGQGSQLGRSGRARAIVLAVTVDGESGELRSRRLSGETGEVVGFCCSAAGPGARRV